MASVHDIWREIAEAAPNTPALVDDGREQFVSHGQLLAMVDATAVRIGGGKKLVFLAAETRVEAVAAWLACWKVGSAVALVSPNLPAELRAPVIDAYRPDLLIGPEGWGDTGGYAAESGDPWMWRRSETSPEPIHPELGLILFTSGTTGSPKGVRLRTSSVAHNTGAIMKSLDLGPDDRVLAHLALNYSYGMSVVNTHLSAGGAVILTKHSLASPAIWKRAAAFGATTMPSVPAQMALLDRLKIEPARFCPSLTGLTQAGGKVDAAILAAFAAQMQEKGGRLHVMYGQTEASPRMACQEITNGGDPASAGRVLDGGVFEIVDEHGQPTAQGNTGLVRYHGPNVMMGYAESRTDLGMDDECGGVLDTGDVGYLGPTGLLYIVGRSKRFAKIGGIRCNLDELERAADQVSSPSAVLPLADSVVVFWTPGAIDNPRRAAAELARALGFPTTGLEGRLIEAIPLLDSGKTNYTGLRALLGS